ncbi:unnamed protein product [Polarella glacialis]|uniref:Uncharacterized protein n=1 Tax=Polarella glacialis TaxID=89957 RepID=A0A813DCL7_POLGL|nr:unnamed protein product [Polarella glacialis]
MSASDDIATYAQALAAAFDAIGEDADPEACADPVAENEATTTTTTAGTTATADDFRSHEDNVSLNEASSEVPSVKAEQAEAVAVKAEQTEAAEFVIQAPSENGVARVVKAEQTEAAESVLEAPSENGVASAVKAEQTEAAESVLEARAAELRAKLLAARRWQGEGPARKDRCMVEEGAAFSSASECSASPSTPTHSRGSCTEDDEDARERGDSQSGKEDEDEATKEWRALLSARALRFELPQQESPSKTRKMILSEGLPSNSDRPRKRQRTKRGLLADAGIDECMATLLGSWKCEFPGKSQIHAVERGHHGYLVCKVWECSSKECGAQWARKNEFKITVSADGTEIMWGSAGQVWLEKESLSDTGVVWRSDRGRSWRWHRGPELTSGADGSEPWRPTPS